MYKFTIILSAIILAHFQSNARSFNDQLSEEIEHHHLGLVRKWFMCRANKHTLNNLLS